MTRSLTKTFSPSHLRRTPTTRARRQRTPTLEGLEVRVVPSLTLSLQEAGVNGGVPTVVGTGTDFTSASFTGTYGDFDVTILGGASVNNAAQSSLQSSTVAVQNHGTSTATLNITVFQDNYTLPAGSPLNVESGLGGSVDHPDLTLSNIFQAYASSTNNHTFDFTNGPQSATPNGTNFDTGAATGLFNRTAGNQYALSSTATIQLTPGGIINFASHVDVKPHANVVTTIQPSSSVTAGSFVFDTAKVQNQVAGIPATGTVLYTFSGTGGTVLPALPNGSSFTLVNGTWQETVTLVTVNGVGTVPNSDATPPLPAGSYQFTATYSGDNFYNNNSPVTSAPEPLTVTPPASQALTWGFWKNHDGTGPQADAWPIGIFHIAAADSHGPAVTYVGKDVGGIAEGTFTVGGHTYSADDVRSIFGMPVQGNALLDLGHQLFAAILNVANGAGTPTAVSEIKAASDLLAANSLVIGVDSVTAGSPLYAQFTDLASQLDAFNSSGH
jgi:hypothetical protein